jgi:hypothetical protein
MDRGRGQLQVLRQDQSAGDSGGCTGKKAISFKIKDQYLQSLFKYMQS